MRKKCSSVEEGSRGLGRLGADVGGAWTELVLVASVVSSELCPTGQPTTTGRLAAGGALPRSNRSHSTRRLVICRLFPAQQQSAALVDTCRHVVCCRSAFPTIAALVVVLQATTSLALRQPPLIVVPIVSPTTPSASALASSSGHSPRAS